MVYLREKIFIEKLLAALKLNGCSRIDISDETINNTISLLYQILKEKKMLNDIDELNLLFKENCDHKYTDIFRIIDSLDPLFGEIDDDTLSIIVDDDLAMQMTKTDFMFKNDDIIDIANSIKEQLIKKDKVKEYKFNAFNYNF